MPKEKKGRLQRVPLKGQASKNVIAMQSAWEQKHGEYLTKPNAIIKLLEQIEVDQIADAARK